MGFDPYGLIDTYKAKCTEELKTSRQRSRLTTDLTEKAQVAHRTGIYETSFDLFCHLLAICETDPKTTKVSEVRATLTANIGSALQFLGELELAKDLYEKALDEFAKVGTGWMTWLYYGNLTDKRMQYIRARLEMISKGEKPDPSTYQDGTGRTRHWTHQEMEGTENNWSFFSPYSWMYGGYKPVGAQEVVTVVPNTTGAATAI